MLNNKSRNPQRELVPIRSNDCTTGKNTMGEKLRRRLLELVDPSLTCSPTQSCVIRKSKSPLQSVRCRQSTMSS
jgi:hypothetical protein